MSNRNPPGADPRQTLQTLDQLSQALKVMSEVLGRLQRHLRRQLRDRDQQNQPDQYQPDGHNSLLDCEPKPHETAAEVVGGGQSATAESDQATHFNVWKQPSGSRVIH